MAFSSSNIHSDCDLIPSCRFQPSFDVLALCSHFPSHSGIWFPTSLRDGEWYNLCLSVCSSLSQPLHFFSSDQPMSHNLFYTHPPSTTTFLFTCRCLSVHASLVFLRSTAWIGSIHTPSVSSSRSCFVHHFFHWTNQPCLFQKHLLNVLRADHPHVHRHLLLKHQGVPLRLASSLEYFSSFAC